MTKLVNEHEFQTGWFVESLATQTLVLLVIRTMGNPFRSRPSRPLLLTTLFIAALGVVLPFTPIAKVMGFTHLPEIYYFFLIGATVAYLGMVEIGKRLLAARRIKTWRAVPA